MNNHTKIIAIAVSALMFVGALTIFIPSEEVAASHPACHISKAIVLENKPLTDYEEYGLTWDYTHNKATMEDFNLFRTSNDYSWIYAITTMDRDSVEIELKGTNTITVNLHEYGFADVKAIYGNSVTLTGNGTLNIVINAEKATRIADTTCGLSLQKGLTIDGCKVSVTVNDGKDIMDLHAVEAWEGLNIVNGAELKVATNNVHCSGDCYGVYGHQDITVKDSRTDISCINADGNAYGIVALDSRNVSISDSFVKSEASTSAFRVNVANVSVNAYVRGGDDLGKKPMEIVGVEHINDHKVVWVTSERPVPEQVLQIVVILAVFAGVMVAALSFLRKY